MSTHDSQHPSPSEASRLAVVDSALGALAEMGYARTSLDALARRPECADVVIRNYFEDKFDLVLQCIRHYKAQCATRYDLVIATSASAKDLRDGFIDKMVESLRADAALHRLWYDLRNQAMYEPALQGDIRAIDQLLESMIWRVVTRYAELSNAKLQADASTCYAALDGIFQRALLAHLSGVRTAEPNLRRSVVELLPQFLAPAR